MISRLEEVKQQFRTWHSEYADADSQAIEEYFTAILYDETNTLREHGSSALQTGEFVIALNGFFDEVLNGTELLLAGYERQYEAACSMKEPTRSRFLSDLLTKMEYKFKIPLQRNAEFDATNKEVMALYRRALAVRDL